jgi:hypothetical protein
MRAIPNLAVLVPADANETRAMTRAICPARNTSSEFGNRVESERAEILAPLPIAPHAGRPSD